jgi:hypothetical protein
VEPSQPRFQEAAGMRDGHHRYTVRSQTAPAFLKLNQIVGSDGGRATGNEHL